MKRLATLLLCSAFIPLPLIMPVYAQGSASTVVTSCGAQAIPTSQGTSGTFIDATGDLCTNATGGGGGGAITAPLGTQTLGNSVAVTTGNGNDVVEGSQADAAACPSGTSKTVAGCLAQLHADATAAIPAGANIIGKVGIDQTTPGTTDHVSAAQVGAWTTQPISGTTGGVTPFTLTAANSTNAANVKATPGTLYHIGVYNNSATLAWVSFYNTAGTPTCGTSIVYQTMIPANSTSGAGAVEDFTTGMAFATGIGICVTTGIAGTGSVAATSYVVGLGYK